MAPHDTNTRKEVRRHRGPLIGIAAVLVFAALALFWWLANVAQGPEGTDAVEEQPLEPTEPATE